MEFTENEIEQCLAGNIKLLKLGIHGKGSDFEVITQCFLGNYGTADIIVFDYRKRVIHVIEVKRNKSKPQDYAQCLRYVEAIKSVANDTYRVRGIIASCGHSDDVVWLLQNINNIFQWDFEISITDGISGRYIPKSGWTRGNGFVGKELISKVCENG